ncbi:hypothetical protein GCM10023116_43680 [Kistimonas scapharcae]|uniref:Uncharacterized protein n=1 Tax=Kistimonas scapharcae TaxID=1036133 RepID=A0ABP8V979_9GAMM
MRWAECEAELIKPPKGDKTPLKHHLLKVYEATGKKPKQLAEQPEKPQELDYLLGWFYDLHNATRGQITFTEIRNWSELMHVSVRAWEVEVIRRLAVIFAH